MPRTPAAGAVAESQMRSARMPNILLDIELADNATRFYWGMEGGSFPMRLGPGGNAQYLPYVKSFGPYRFSRSLRTDSGDVKIQNISGNSIVRDVANILSLNEFDGALFVARYWRPLSQTVDLEIHGKLSEPVPAETEVAFRLLQLFDANQQSVPKRGPGPNCSLHYLSPQCGSVSGLPTCDLLFSSCVTRAAVERFNGLPFAITPKSTGLRRNPRDFNFERGRRGMQL